LWFAWYIFGVQRHFLKPAPAPITEQAKVPPPPKKTLDKPLNEYDFIAAAMILHHRLKSLGQIQRVRVKAAKTYITQTKVLPEFYAVINCLQAEIADLYFFTKNLNTPDEENIREVYSKILHSMEAEYDLYSLLIEIKKNPSSLQLYGRLTDENKRAIEIYDDAFASCAELLSVHSKIFDAYIKTLNFKEN